ncbi:large conductance mechanosensitive channel protein MscL [Mycoplasma zalophidermidis]|uniref:MscL family protein n=1 Tax=Mycoplasma zalophidermidis TaxID=398174 RepID=A0ABS6DS08_9MOLU|nr:MscL family protein [Mycoplasma zalophidermidis]MBU4689919.1 MscL family protein [Mycoplasma zalophidermidis]MBU4693790.1 MscL family protein [Mycoplasma zalophidermidis]MCR8966796.1 MscL family protein [Mycoplasma zalophidermidis]
MFKKASKDAWAVVKKSNMFMLAIGLLIGTSFNGVVKSLANDVILPPIAKLTGAETLEKWKIGEILIGKFLAALFAFIIVTLVIYLLLMIVFLIKAVVDFKKILKIKDQPQPIPEPTTEQLILAELKKMNENFESAKTKKEDKE